MASSTLLTGMVKAQSEQYVYFDNTIGRNATVTVSVGEEVSVGQQLANRAPQTMTDLPSLHRTD